MLSLSSISKDNFEKILSNKMPEPDWILNNRKKTISLFSELPFEVSPLYSKYSGLNLLDPQKVFFSNDQSSALSEELKIRYEEIKSSPSLIMLGASIVHIHIPENLSKQGLIISSIEDAFKNHTDLLKKYFEDNESNYGIDRFLALGLSSFQSGFFIYVPKNMILNEPIRIVYSLGYDRLSSICRNIVISDIGSKATIVQELYSPPTSSSSVSSNTATNGMNNNENSTTITNNGNNNGKINNFDKQQCYIEVLECNVKPTSELEFITLQAMDISSVNISSRKAFVERDGKMSWYSGLFGTNLSRYKIDSIMKGPGASSEDVEIIFGTKKQLFDVSSNLDHDGYSTRGRVLVKSVMKDESKSLFKGMIKIRKDAKTSEAYLAGHAILLNKGSHSDAIPGLEIETNEVRATHSASVSQIDEEQIFYLMCRGLDRESAKREIVHGFVEPLSRKMDPFVRAWISYLFENKWTGKPLLLKTDEVMAGILEVEKSRYKETADIFEKHYKYR
jgi:Fe-S cluster assembly scaffold protein SufB